MSPQRKINSSFSLTFHCLYGFEQESWSSTSYFIEEKKLKSVLIVGHSIRFSRRLEKVGFMAFCRFYDRNVYVDYGLL